MSTTKVSASLLSADFLNLGAEIQACLEAGVDSFHLDVMDGHLAPNLSYGPPVIKAIRSATKAPLEAHLMIDNPDVFLDDYLSLDLQTIFIHAEAYDGLSHDPRSIKNTPRSSQEIRHMDALIRDLKRMSSSGVLAGVTLNPSTSIETIQPCLEYADSVLIMSVNPGFSGQRFIPETLDKIETLRRIFKGDIQVDGGVNGETAASVIKSGADTLITASYLFGSEDYQKSVQTLKNG